MRVLHVNTYDVGGGAEQVCMDLSQNQEFSTLLVKKKFSQNPNVIALPEFGLDRLISFVDKLMWKLNLKNGFKSSLFLGEQLNQTLRKLETIKYYKEADIVHLHNIHGNYFDLESLQNIASKKKLVWTLHDMWPITGGEAYAIDDGYKTGNTKSSFKHLPPLNNPIIDRRNFFLNKKKKLYKSIGSNLSFVAVSNWLSERVKESYVYDSIIPINTIYNGVHTNIFKNYNKRNWKIPRLLFFNSSSPYKGSNLFTAIIDKIKHDVELWVVGNKLVGLDVSNIKVKHLSRLNNRKDLANLYNNVDILIFPSIAENFPLTVLESMACGVFVIASDAGGIPEIINDNSIGTLFKNRNAQSLLEIINLALGDLNDCRTKGFFASEEIKKKYDLKDILQSYFSLYTSLLSS